MFNFCYGEKARVLRRNGAAPYRMPLEAGILAPYLIIAVLLIALIVTRNRQQSLMERLEARLERVVEEARYEIPPALRDPPRAARRH